MSDISQRNLTNAQITTDYDLSKIFLLNNRYESDNWSQNSNYSTLTLRAGTVMGRNAAGNLAPSISGVRDGSQVPIGILAHDVTLLAGQTRQVTICIDGDVNASQLIWLGGDNPDTVVDGRLMRDHLKAYGPLLRFSDRMTDYDN